MSLYISYHIDPNSISIWGIGIISSCTWLEHGNEHSKVIQIYCISQTSVKPDIMRSSIVNDGEMLPANVSSSEDIADLSNWIEEDAGFAVHVDWAVWMKRCKGTTCIAFLNDTDPFFLYYCITGLTFRGSDSENCGNSMVLLEIDACFHCINQYPTRSLY